MNRRATTASTIEAATTATAAHVAVLGSASRGVSGDTGAGNALGNGSGNVLHAAATATRANLLRDLLDGSHELGVVRLGRVS